MVRILSLIKNKYIIYLILVVLFSVLSYYKGYNDKSEEVKLEQLQQFYSFQKKLDDIYKLSSAEADKAKVADTKIAATLETILGKVKGKPLSNVPCVPSDEFKDAWRKLDENTNN